MVQRHTATIRRPGVRFSTRAVRVSVPASPRPGYSSPMTAWWRIRWMLFAVLMVHGGGRDRRSAAHEEREAVTAGVFADGGLGFRDAGRRGNPASAIMRSTSPGRTVLSIPVGCRYSMWPRNSRSRSPRSCGDGAGPPCRRSRRRRPGRHGPRSTRGRSGSGDAGAGCAADVGAGRVQWVSAGSSVPDRLRRAEGRAPGTDPPTVRDPGGPGSRPGGGARPRSPR